MKSAPLCLQKLVYGDGSYNLIIDEEESTSQHIDGIYKAIGLNWHFMKSYHVLHGLSDMIIDFLNNQFDFSDVKLERL